MIKIKAAGATDIGLVRSSNEDSLGLFPELGLFVVADGMGGHAAGEVASRMAVDLIKEYFSRPSTSFSASSNTQKSGDENRLREAISYANLEVFSASIQDASLSGMGTTVIAIFATSDEVVVGFVGDSRLYLHRNGKGVREIVQLTQDHSLVNDYLQKGLVTPEAARNHPQRHILSRALGTGRVVDVESFRKVPEPGDIFLLCSDGLSNKLTPSEINQCLVDGEGELQKIADQLIQEAKEKGGEDNITVLLVACLE
ncbi:MAG: Stp1/IreP family PP2C-type Ser/Thr phosphatase [Nitrospiria bacterium]